MNDLSLRTKLLWLTIGPLLLVVLAGTSFVAWEMDRNGERRLEQFRAELLAEQETMLTDHTAIALGAVRQIYQASEPQAIQGELQQRAEDFRARLNELYEQNKNRLSPRDLRLLLIQFTKGYRIEKTGYFWINDLAPRMVMHPTSPGLDGKFLGDTKDPEGVFLFRRFVKVAQEKGQGFVEYIWPNPASKQKEKKISYVFLFKPFNWVIGTGEYYPEVQRRLKERAAHIIKGLRYGEDGYFWINDFDARMVMHPAKPKLDGQDMSDFKDPKGKPIFLEFAQVGREQGQGIVRYSWPKPGAEQPQPKLSYVASFPAWEWVIGTGVYIDHIDEMVSQEQARLGQELSRLTLILIVSASVVSAGMVFLTVLLLRKFILHPFARMSEFLVELGQGDLRRGQLPVKYHDEIGEVTKQMNRFADSLKQRVDLAEEVAVGRMDHEVEMLSPHDGLGHALQGMVEGLKAKAQSARLIAGGDLSQNVPLAGPSDGLGQALAQMNQDLNGILGGLSDDSQRLASTSTELSAVSTQMANSSTEMSAETRNIAAATEEMSASIASLSSGTDEIAGNARSIAENTDQINRSMTKVTEAVGALSQSVHSVAQQMTEAATQVNQAQELSGNATEAMSRLAENNQSINQVAKLIQNISAQTRMLALNATIESASAGVAGKGFAVVAGEIKDLAQQSGKASADISERVTQIEAETRQSIQAVRQVLDGIAEVTTAIAQASQASQQQASQTEAMEREIRASRDKVEQVAQWTEGLSASVAELSRSASELSTGAQEVSKTMGQLDQASNETAQGAEHIRAEANRLSELANRLQSEVGRFQLAERVE